MHLRKNYFSVKIPTSTPEPEEISELFPAEPLNSYKNNSDSIIYESHRLAAMAPRTWLPFFPVVSNFKSSSAFKKSKVHSTTPIKIRRYVESILEYKGKSEKKQCRNYSSFVMAKQCSQRPKKMNFFKVKLLPILNEKKLVI